MNVYLENENTLECRFGLEAICHGKTTGEQLFTPNFLASATASKVSTATYLEVCNTSTTSDFSLQKRYLFVAPVS